MEFNQRYKKYFKELKNRVILSTIFIVVFWIICYCKFNVIESIVVSVIKNNNCNNNINTSYIGTISLFITRFNYSFVSSLFICLPVVISQIYFFIISGLFKRERIFVTLLFMIGILLFYLGSIISVKFVIPFSMKFLLSFPTTVDSKIVDIPDVFAIFFTITFITGLIFEIPIIMVILVVMKLVTVKIFVSIRKYYIVLSLVISAILTPPDIMSQMILSAIMIIMYEITIIACRFIK